MTGAALALESLLPAVMVNLFRMSVEQDPLRNLSVGQVRLMRALLQGKQTATKLGQKLGMSPSALTQMAARLISAGLVMKRQASGDRRVRELELTELGLERMTLRRKIRVKQATEVLSRFPPEKTATLIALLQEIAALDQTQTDLSEVLV